MHFGIGESRDTPCPVSCKTEAKMPGAGEHDARQIVKNVYDLEVSFFGQKKLNMKE